MKIYLELKRLWNGVVCVLVTDLFAFERDRYFGTKHAVM